MFFFSYRLFLLRFLIKPSHFFLANDKLSLLPSFSLWLCTVHARTHIYVLHIHFFFLCVWISLDVLLSKLVAMRCWIQVPPVDLIIASVFRNIPNLHKCWSSSHSYSMKGRSFFNILMWDYLKNIKRLARIGKEDPW